MVPPPTSGFLRELCGNFRFSESAFRLDWQLKGSLEESITISDSKERYVTGTPHTPSFSLHQISQDPVSQPRVSEVTIVTCLNLHSWLPEWLYEHYDCVGPDREFAPEAPAEDVAQPVVPYETCDEYLLSCCGTKRPIKVEFIKVRATDKPYVTIHDYVSAVHPWLMAQSDNIRESLGILAHEPLPRNVPLFVKGVEPDSIRIAREGD